MANKVITVTDPSVVTNDTLSGYNNYSDIDGQLGTTMTPTEATNGKTITLSDGVVHEVTTKPVGTTNGEFSAVVSNAVTVDLAVSTTYGITNKAADSQSMTTPALTPSIGFEISFRIRDRVSTTGWVFTNNASAGNDGSFALRQNSVTSYYLTVAEDGGDAVVSANTTIADDDLIAVRYSAANTWELWVNGSLSKTVSLTSFTPVSNKICIGALTDAGSQGLGALTYDLTIDSETWSFAEQTGTTATGSASTIITLNPGTGSVDTMWNEVV